MKEISGYASVNKEAFIILCKKLIEHYTISEKELSEKMNKILLERFEESQKCSWKMFRKESFEQFKNNISFMTLMHIPGYESLFDEHIRCSKIISTAEMYLDTLENPLVEKHCFDIEKVNWLTRLAGKI